MCSKEREWGREETLTSEDSLMFQCDKSMRPKLPAQLCFPFAMERLRCELPPSFISTCLFLVSLYSKLSKCSVAVIPCWCSKPEDINNFTMAFWVLIRLNWLVWYNSIRKVYYSKWQLHRVGWFGQLLRKDPYILASVGHAQSITTQGKWENKGQLEITFQMLLSELF